MTNLIDQLPTLIGVVIGALASYASSQLADRSRWRRERLTRWDTSKLEALSNYASAIKAETRICLRIAATTGLSPRPDPLDPAVGAAMLTAAEDQRTTQFESLLLLADPPTVAAARQWQQSVWALHPHVTPDATGAQFLEQFRQAGIAREAFYRAARESLDITTGQPVSTVPATWGDVGDHKL